LNSALPRSLLNLPGLTLAPSVSIFVTDERQYTIHGSAACPHASFFKSRPSAYVGTHCRQREHQPGCRAAAARNSSQGRDRFIAAGKWRRMGAGQESWQADAPRHSASREGRVAVLHAQSAPESQMPSRQKHPASSQAGLRAGRASHGKRAFPHHHPLASARCSTPRAGLTFFRLFCNF